jgi:N,N'-diacetyllegionaminate synthase
LKESKVIVEIGQAHEGSLGMLHSYIDAVAKTNADFIKFQTHIAHAESSLQEPFRVNFSYEDKCRFDYWKRMEFTKEQWIEIKEHCQEVGIGFLSSPFSIEAAELLLDIGIEAFKIGSGEVTNALLLDFVAQSGKQVLLSSGMSSFDELDAAIKRIEKYNKDLVIFQCTTSYPTTFDQIGLNVIEELINKYDYPIGLSDHSSSIFPGIAAVSKGASWIEVHGVFSKDMFGPDSKSSLTMGEIEELVSGVRAVDLMVNNPIDKQDLSKYKELKGIFEKSLAIRKDLTAGHIIAKEDLETKKPADRGISAREYEKLIGKTLVSDMSAQSFINWSDVK